LIDNLPDAIYAKDTVGPETLANLADLKNLHSKPKPKASAKRFRPLSARTCEKLNADDQKVFRRAGHQPGHEYFLDDQGREHWL